jgi:hypothetical protein
MQTLTIIVKTWAKKSSSKSSLRLKEDHEEGPEWSRKGQNRGGWARHTLYLKYTAPCCYEFIISVLNVRNPILINLFLI